MSKPEPQISKQSSLSLGIEATTQISGSFTVEPKNSSLPEHHQRRKKCKFGEFGER
jgi:hypothetical protein